MILTMHPDHGTLYWVTDFLFCWVITEIAFAFVFRQVLKPNSLADGAPLKRKAGTSVTKVTFIGLIIYHNIGLLF